jgi:hypothetical protein
MPNEATETDVSQTEATQTPNEATPVYVNANGTFNEGWQNCFVPEEHRNNSTWLGVKNVGDMVNQIAHLNSKLGKQGKGIFPINENSTPLEVAEYRKTMGVPDTPDGYTLNIPDDVKRYYEDDEFMAEAKSFMHTLELSNKQFSGIMAFDALRMKKAEEAMKSDPMEFYEQALELAMPIMAQEAEKELRLKWGPAYDTRLQLANAAVTENTKEGQERDALLERIGNDPLVADFIATIQNKHYTESHGIDTSLGSGGIAKSVQQQIDDISNKLSPQLKLTNRPLYDELLAQKNKLYVQLYPEH